MPSSPTTDFDKLIEKIRVKLPIQNPLHSYVHNNILLMFEGKDFHDALAEAAKLYRARAYWPMAKYLERFHEGKIIEQDIFDGIEHYLGNYNNFKFLDKLGLTAKEFMYRLMFSDLAFHDDETQPVIDDKRLWDACMEKVQGQQLTLKRSPIKWRAKEYWENYHNETVASSTQPHIIRITSSYLDQGQSFWQNPFVTKDFWSFFCADTMAIAPFGSGWQKILAEKVSVYQNKSSQEVIETELEKMSIPRAEWESYLLEMLFDLKGWAGMVSKLEVEPWQATVKAPNIKLVDYIAGILLIE